MTATNMCYNFVGFRYSPPPLLSATGFAWASFFPGWFWVQFVGFLDD